MMDPTVSECVQFHRWSADFLESCLQPDGTCKVPDGMQAQYFHSTSGLWKNCKPRPNFMIRVEEEDNPGNLYMRLVAKRSRKRKTA